MATAYQNLSEYDFNSVPDASEMNVGIVVAEWNRAITEKLLEGACNVLERHGVKQGNILIGRVPGSVELTFGAKRMAESKELDAVIVLGCVVRGDTPHFDYVCDSVTQGVTELNLMYDIPFIFGLLTTDNMQQAEDRAGGKYGNKGEEAAVTAIKMADFSCKLRN
ncbi:6,7-dimethyl-8-ribityllumazine synthase [Parabacteroides sp. PFB2-12]|uniref:6,7-dimethyl-8-ribityllumazine synthase n=1 Tax=unclassified Parabacteroides TaxID=2649774 RepID=UPI002474D523|nr:MULTISPECIES: 6,7-dimethyl-8-ribityllumazine synthase [unclassified Parabacteroides]MDH6341616.1 6,7-dimethyl-8-ribityllumazine synthase [Parabacteroides sp. PM6-13]MDH6389961.1 6,7-dimethyl-8-ribityllumazine synthase [Parabacteroides sp. PFB2-12]MDL2309681.1 6,7-dimethyl-8-ribityllumazine synthase [Parabacteroides sp. OttesenSCG-928-B22]